MLLKASLLLSLLPLFAAAEHAVYGPSVSRRHEVIAKRAAAKSEAIDAPLTNLTRRGEDAKGSNQPFRGP